MCCPICDASPEGEIAVKIYDFRGLMAILSCLVGLEFGYASLASGQTSAIVEEAKKEGEVAATLQSNLKPQGVTRIQQAIKQTYGVDLRINHTPPGSYPQRLATALSEHKAGLPASYDLMVFSAATAYKAHQGGIFENVNWKPLLPKGTPGDVVLQDLSRVIILTSHVGMLYNPQVVKPQDAPRSLEDLAQPKFRGKFVLASYTSHYVALALVTGEEKLVATLRRVMENKPAIQTYAEGLTRFTSGEYSMVHQESQFYYRARDMGLPAAFTPIEMSFATLHSLGVRKGARHPNAAKLLTLFLVGPQGQKILADEFQGANLFYPDNHEHEIAAAEKKMGIPIFRWETWPGALDFLVSKKGEELETKIAGILTGR